MNILQLTSRAAVAAALAATLAGCASQLVAVRPGSDAIALLEPGQVTNCTSKGEINVSVMSEAGPFTRSSDAVEANLLQLARNGAVESGGDTVVKGNSLVFGKRTYAIYKCR